MIKAAADESPIVEQLDTTGRLPGAPPATGLLAVAARIVDGLALVLFVAMMGVVLLQVATRFLQISAIWTEELARILFVVSSLLAIAACTWRREHIIVDYFLDHMKPARRRVTLTVIDVLILFFLIIWLRGAFTQVRLNADATYVTVPWIKVAWIFGVEIASILLMILFVAADLAARFRRATR